MKKLVTAFLMNFFVLFNVCCANSYDNDPDYYFVMNVQRAKTYLYLPSIDVQIYNPPNYQIAGLFIALGGIDHDANHVSKYKVTIRYNFYTKDAFELENGKWRKLCQGVSSSTLYAMDRLTANALLLAAYGIKFYE